MMIKTRVIITRIPKILQIKIYNQMINRLNKINQIIWKKIIMYKKFQKMINKNRINQNNQNKIN